MGGYIAPPPLSRCQQSSNLFLARCVALLESVKICQKNWDIYVKFHSGIELKDIFHSKYHGAELRGVNFVWQDVKPCLRVSKCFGLL